MSSLKDKLSRLTKSTEAPRKPALTQDELAGDSPDRDCTGACAEEGTDDSGNAGGDTDGGGTLLGGSWNRMGAKAHHNERGHFVIRRIVYPFDYRHGTYCLGDLIGEAEPLAALGASASKTKGGRSGASRRSSSVSADPAPAVCARHDRLLFLDTETTGLGVGAGNVPFMVGIGFYEPDGFVVEQMFIRNPAEEAAMLQHLREKLAERDLLVSYNGKCFDWPIIKNRYILNRQKDGAVDPVHYDFLYPSRSLWRNTLPSCRLSSVERERLGLSRIDDVPGSLAPALYFQYLAEGDAALVEGVFEHNEKDVLTLACLAVHFTRLLGGQIPLSRMEPEELYRLALWLDKLGRPGEAEETMRELLDRETDNAADYWLSAASFYKRQGSFGAAVSLWERYIERKRRARVVTPEPYIELAMYYEHREKDLDKALQYAELALERSIGRMAAVRKEGASAEEAAAIRKRIDRLRLKRETAAQPARTAKAPATRKSRRTAVRTVEVWQQTLL
ncbi:ribonuclease H-like domain-containing protein [Paenibacillus sp. GCM10012303]|uniref:ribonuclease H-like domain-containing protein n=1 Tax=Paenibacillus sp. GCM10012303 TaxID=3317340 RepID=UPI0036107F74